MCNGALTDQHDHIKFSSISIRFAVFYELESVIVYLQQNNIKYRKIGNTRMCIVLYVAGRR